MLINSKCFTNWFVFFPLNSCVSLTVLVHWALLEQRWLQKTYWRQFLISHHIIVLHVRHQDLACHIQTVPTITLNTIEQNLFNQMKSYDKQFQMPVRLLSFVNELPTEIQYNKIQDWNKNLKKKPTKFWMKIRQQMSKPNIIIKYVNKINISSKYYFYYLHHR